MKWLPYQTSVSKTYQPNVPVVVQGRKRVDLGRTTFFYGESQFLLPLSTDAQETHLQMDALKRVKCSRVYEEKASGVKADRPELTKLLDNARRGDVVVCKLNRLARSLRQLIDTTVLPNGRGV